MHGCQRRLVFGPDQTHLVRVNSYPASDARTRTTASATIKTITIRMADTLLTFCAVPTQKAVEGSRADARLTRFQSGFKKPPARFPRSTGERGKGKRLPSTRAVVRQQGSNRVAKKEKHLCHYWYKCLYQLVGRGRFELPTLCLKGRYSTD